MNPILNSLNLPNAPALPNASAGANASAATTAPGEAGAFAQLLGSYAAAPMPPRVGAADTAPATATDIAADALMPAPSGVTDDTTRPQPGQETTDTPPVDAALIAALLGQMQTPYVMPVQTASAPRALAPAPAAAEIVRTPAALPCAPAAADGQGGEPVMTGAFTMPGATVAPAMPGTPEMPDTADANASLQPVGLRHDTAAAPAYAASATTTDSLGTADAALNEASTQPTTAPDAAPTAQAPTAHATPLPAEAAAARAGATLPRTPASVQSIAPADDETGPRPVSLRADNKETTDGTGSADGEGKMRPGAAPRDAEFRRALELNVTDDEREATADSVLSPTTATGTTPQPRTALFKTPREHGSDIVVAAAAPAAIATRGESAPPALSIAPPLASPEWQPAFTHNVKLLVQEGSSAASLQLNPAEFGPIDVRITVTDQRADIAFMVTHPDANAAIQSALSDLRDQLARSGIQLGQTSVGAHPQDPRQQAATPQRGTPAGREVAAVPVSAPPAPVRSRGKIDVYA